MKKVNLKTFCPLPWNHISANSGGHARFCCLGSTTIKNDQGKTLSWSKFKDLHSYLNHKDYKKIRKQMLSGERPEHCKPCFEQEDNGVKSLRVQFAEQYKEQKQKMIENTNEDGSVEKVNIQYVDMTLGNDCNLKCQMCNPYSSYPIAKDWKKMGVEFDADYVEKMHKNKWYESSDAMAIFKEALPNVRHLFTTGGEPLIIKSHLKILQMIIDAGEAHHVALRYNSNQTVLPKPIQELWKHFEEVAFNCSIEAYGQANDYIRYPSKWDRLEKNLHLLDKMAEENKHIQVYIHSTVQAYNLPKIPEFLDYLREVDFKNIHRFPFFILVEKPIWLSPDVFPKKEKDKMIDNILDSLAKHEDFFLNYNSDHLLWTQERLSIFKDLCLMIKNTQAPEEDYQQFIEKTKKYDHIRNQSISNFIPELDFIFKENDN